MRGALLFLCLSLSHATEDPGRALFDAAGCRACHKVGPRGGSSGPDLSFAGFRHGREWLERWLEDPRAWDPRALMPNFRLKPKARAALAEFLVAQKGRAFGPGERPWEDPDLGPDLARQGKVLYLRAGCVACHGAKGVGGRPNNNVPGGRIPALNAVSQSYTPQELTARIRRGVKPQKADPHGPEPLVSMPAWGDVLQEHEIEAVAAYLLTLGDPKTADW